MRYAFIGCEVLFREFCISASRSPVVLDAIWMPQGLHNIPDNLRAGVQKEIDRIDGPNAQERKFDAILLGYALCSNGVVGLHSYTVPLVIPRAHDCVSLLLGSKDKYQEYFDNHAGIYWYSSGWIERTLQPGKERYDNTFQHYVDVYGEDNAEYLMEVEQGWYKGYNWATYIDWELVTSESDKKYTRECAEYLGWNYDEVKGDPKLFYDFVDGNWNPEIFQVIEPGSVIEPEYNGMIVKSCAGCANHGEAQCKDVTPLMSNR
ncbi:MAG: DUF1638 domain-containing protein [bacterium]